MRGSRRASGEEEAACAGAVAGNHSTGAGRGPGQGRSGWAGTEEAAAFGAPCGARAGGVG